MIRVSHRPRVLPSFAFLRGTTKRRESKFIQTILFLSLGSYFFDSSLRLVFQFVKNSNLFEILHSNQNALLLFDCDLLYSSGTSCTPQCP